MNERQVEIVRTVNSAINQALEYSDSKSEAVELAGECVRGIVQGLTDEEADWALDTLAAFHETN